MRCPSGDSRSINLSRRKNVPRSKVETQLDSGAWLIWQCKSLTWKRKHKITMSQNMVQCITMVQFGFVWYVSYCGLGDHEDMSSVPRLQQELTGADASQHVISWISLQVIRSRKVLHGGKR